MDFEQVLNDTANHNLNLVQGFPGISNKTVWVTADSVPTNVEVVTRYPLSEARELRALVDCIRGKSSISFGLIVPEDSFMKPQMLSLGDGEHLRGELCAWNSSSNRIYRKQFDSSIACGKAKEILFHTCVITEGSVLTVFRDLKKETVHLTINGIEQTVSIGGCCPNFCYGYLRLSANGGGSKIRVRLIPRENEAYFKQLPSAKATRGCLRFFKGLGRVLPEVLGLGSLFSSVPVNGNQVQEEVAEEPETNTGPDAEHEPGSEPEGEASDPELESESEGEDSHPESELNSENESNSELESESELGDAEPGTDLKLEAGCQPEQESQSELSHYAMDKRPRGICLLINNARNLPHVEEQVLDFFSLLAFEVRVRRGLHKYQVYKVAHEFARVNHNQFNLFVCVLMSVCEQDQEFCDVDGKKVAIEDLMSEYKPSVHSSLTNKPKLFFVMKFTTQRSKLRKIRSIPIDGSTTKDETPYSPCDAFEETCPKEADFLLHSVTSIVDEEMQDPQSSFVQVFENVTKQYGHLNYHLLELLVKVNEQLKNIGDGRTDGLLPFRVPYLTHTLRRRLYLEFDRPLYAPLPACITEPQHGNEEIHNGLKVEHSKYNMSRSPRGICLILNNIEFLGGGKRRGAEFDEEELRILFTELSFDVQVARDLRYDQMRNLVAQVAKRNHKNHDAFVLIVMSHGGDNDVIYGVDNRAVRVEDLISELTQSNCPDLRDKPKMVFIQTCRGSLRERISPNSASADGADSFSTVDSTLSRGVFPKEFHWLLAFATTPGYVASRDPSSGSWFIQVLVKTIRKLHDRVHLVDILTEVTNLVVKSKGEIIQVPAPTHTLTAELYL